ncbi:PREDICTED: uncharacterized protein LOC105555807 [Vollenhovia emeryi]|uniref:uncharacterized protein LOC105555807 n=1 Tax=Vollenhovia emeryi TaxID=411798 RepID=UPI0005F3B891|nr:PREDICTED: uncharacterized protein LOC105555807 [Vollenhovia emeryi]
MSTSHNDNRPKRPITKPSRYQTTSSDEDIPRKVGKQDKSVTKTLESDMRDLRVILQENFSHDYNKNSQTPLLHTLDKVQPYTQTQAQYQPHTPTQVPCPTISTHNQIQYPLQTSTQTPYQPGQIQSYQCHKLYLSQYVTHLLCMSTQNQNVTDNIINTCNKFQANFSNIGRAIQTTTNYSAQRTESEEENRKIQERLSYIETELRKLNNTVERILQCVQTKQDRRRALQKPKCLPISTELEMQTFEMTDEEIYEEVVSL